jgi:hypothetical protein
LGALYECVLKFAFYCLHIQWLYFALYLTTLGIYCCFKNLHINMYYILTYHHVLYIYISPCIICLHITMYYIFTYHHVLYIYISPCIIYLHITMYYIFTYHHVLYIWYLQTFLTAEVKCLY